MVRGCKLLAVLRRGLLILHLRGHGGNTLFVRGRNFSGLGTAGNASRTVITHPAAAGTIISAICYWMAIFFHMYSIDTIYGLVVLEVIPSPVAALISHPAIPVPIVDSAVIANVLTPISIEVAVAPRGITPESRCPEQPRLGRLHPRAGNPVIAFAGITPVTGSPDVTVGGTIGLVIVRQIGWWRGCFQIRLAVARVLVFSVVIVTLVVRLVAILRVSSVVRTVLPLPAISTGGLASPYRRHIG
jgi:hypothetical protein